MNVVVLLAVLLDGDVGQVDVHVVHLTHGVIVLDGAEPTEAVLVQVDLDAGLLRLKRAEVEKYIGILINHVKQL